MATQVMIKDESLEAYLDEVAAENGGMGRATAARFVIADHRRLTRGTSESKSPARNEPAQASQPVAQTAGAT